MKSKDLAIFTPLPPTKSGIADYSIEIGKALSDEWNIYYIIDDQAPTPKSVSFARVMRQSEWNQFDSGNTPRFYQLGNNIHHAYIYNELIRCPGVTLLHDFSMHHLIVELTLVHEDSDTYIRLLSDEYGEAGERIGRLRCENYVHHGINEFFFTLNKQVIQNSKGVVVHSNSSLNELRYKNPETMALRVPFPYEEPGENLLVGGQKKARELLGIDSNKIIFASFGFVTPPKQIEFILRAFAECKNDLPDFEYILVGEVSPSVPIDKVIHELGLEEHVKIAGFVNLETFHHYIEACDVSLSLRYPTAGETSAVLMRSMGLERLNIVFDYASYADFPDETVLKIPLDTNEIKYLAEAIKRSATDDVLRKNISKEGARFLREKHEIKGVANEITEFIENCYKF